MLCVAQPVGAILLSEKESLPFMAGRMSSALSHTKRV
jgi:hypothetical protein